MTWAALPVTLEYFARGVGFRLTRRLPTQGVTDVWPGIETAAVQARPLSRLAANVKLDELMILCTLVSHLRPKLVFEFGTFDGAMAWHLAVNTGPECRVITLDLPLDHPARFSEQDRSVTDTRGIVAGERYQDTPEAAKIEQVYCDSIAFDPAPYRGQLDFCFVDAAHDYEHVRRDTENALAMVRPGGVLVWHDYSRWWPCVQRCLDDLSRRLPVFRISNTSLAALKVPER